MLKGDLNTDYFHKIANGRKKCFHSLTIGEVCIEGTDNLLKHGTQIYKELFGHAPGNMFHLSPETWNDSQKVSQGDNENLIRPLSVKEVKEGMFTMEANRTL